MKKCLVTGASGFIGQVLCKRLSEEKYFVAAGLHRQFNLESNDLWQEAIHLDLTSNSWGRNPCLNIDTVFHLAGKAHALTETAQCKDEYFQINTEGTRRLLEASQRAGVERFIFISSVKAVGDIEKQPMDEDVIELADTPYGQSKNAAEQLVLQGGYVPHPVVIRPCMVYGNSEKGNLPRMIKAVKKGIFPPLPENHNKRSMVHVDDVVRAAILAAENPKAAGQIYIVSDGQPYSTRQIYDWIRQALDKPASNHSVPMFVLQAAAGIGDLFGRVTGSRFPIDSDALQKLTASAWYSSDKITQELGFVPQHTLKESLPEIIRYLG
ncbi:NAD-dependent epimerase/dehydratase family protein [Methylomarinum vadi]|uniref:NAD-dependent epimerase/dehydratase family protein n=1 Tax=Methylomarinum vadi TaxID=438855 RepID=UPI0004DF466F|nr:NAD-dependent epimerase/dehydratase family protein [Methylomarinum vadi]